MFVDEKAVGETAEQKNARLSLSAAIRAGAKLRPQAETKFFIDGKSCALGAAYEAAFGRIPQDANSVRGVGFQECGPDLVTAFPQLREFGYVNAKGDQDTLDMAIASRNDMGDTREQIADWLAAQGL